MQINWCLKGITAGPNFDDAKAAGVLSSTGILSNWMLANAGSLNLVANGASQNALSASALDDHVNNYAAVAGHTPYISLSSGCIEFAGSTRPPNRYTALRTALNFATRGGRQPGYVFRCWVVTSLKPLPELPGFAEEVRDLNLFAGFYGYHRQGEVTAKLVVPRRQVQYVMKFGSDLMPAATTWPAGAQKLDNPDFIEPERLSTIISEIA